VIWQESRFDALAVSPKGAAGITQFMPATASWHGLADPFVSLASSDVRVVPKSAEVALSAEQDSAGILIIT
jgi:hypothetical protein